MTQINLCWFAFREEKENESLRDAIRKKREAAMDERDLLIEEAYRMFENRWIWIDMRDE